MLGKAGRGDERLVGIYYNEHVSPELFVELDEEYSFESSRNGDTEDPVTRVLAGDGEVKFKKPLGWRVGSEAALSQFGRLIDPYVFEHSKGGAAEVGVFGAGGGISPEYTTERVRLGSEDSHKFSVGTVHHRNRDGWLQERASGDSAE